MNKDDLTRLRNNLIKNESLDQLKRQFDKIETSTVRRVAPNSDEELNRIINAAEITGVFREKVRDRSSMSSLIKRIVAGSFEIPFAGAAFASVLCVGLLTGYLLDVQKPIPNRDSQFVLRGESTAVDGSAVGIVDVFVEEPLTILTDILYRLDGVADTIRLQIRVDEIEVLVPDTIEIRTLLLDIVEVKTKETESLQIVIKRIES